MKTLSKFLAVTAVAVAFGSASPSVSASFVNFSGAYDVSNWTTTLSNSNGGVNTGGAPSSITLYGGDNGSSSPGDTDFTIAASTSGIWDFAWSYSTGDWDPSYDPAGYLLNGAFTQLSNDFGPNSQSGTASVQVDAGDVFGWRVHSVDNIYGGAQLTIRELAAVDVAGVPEPATLAILGLGVAGFGYARRRRQQEA